MIWLMEHSGGAFPITEIHNVRYVEQRPGRAEHYVLDRRAAAKPLEIFPTEYADLMARPVQLLLAESGTRLIMVYSMPGDAAAIADSDPVIAWARCLDGQVRPVLPSGVRRIYRFSDQNVWHPDYVQLPDGTIYQYGLESEPGTYADIDAVIAEETARLQKHQAQREAAEASAQGVAA